MSRKKEVDALVKALSLIKSKGYAINQKNKRSGMILNISKPGRQYVEQDLDNQMGFILSGVDKCIYK